MWFRFRTCGERFRDSSVDEDKAEGGDVGMRNRLRMREQHLFSVSKKSPKGTELKL